MAFKHGKYTRVYTNGYNLTGFLKSISSTKAADVGETTVFGLDDKTFVPGKISTTMNANGVFDGATGAVDQIMNAALGASTRSVWCWYHQGDAAVGAAGYGLAGDETAYEIQTPAADVAVVSASVQSSTGRERILSLHPLGAEVASGQGAAIDNGAATTDGGVAYLQVPDLDGAELQVTIEDSADGINWATLATFTAITTDHKAERLAIAGTIRQHVRANWALTGISAEFHVAFGRK